MVSDSITLKPPPADVKPAIDEEGAIAIAKRETTGLVDKYPTDAFLALLTDSSRTGIPLDSNDTNAGTATDVDRLVWVVTETGAPDCPAGGGGQPASSESGVSCGPSVERQFIDANTGEFIMQVTEGGPAVQASITNGGA